MSEEKHPLTQSEFTEIYSKVPRLTVEIIINGNKGLFLTRRSIEPCKGMWHLPGGTVRFGEKLTEAVARIAKRELGVNVSTTELLGYIEYPSHYENGLDSPVGIAFLVKSFDSNMEVNSEASDSNWFKKLPENMHKEQMEFINQKV